MTSYRCAASARNLLRNQLPIIYRSHDIFFFNPKKLRYQAAASWRPLPEFPCHVIQGQRLNFFLPCFLYRQILLSWLSNGPSKLFSLHISIEISHIYFLNVLNKSVLNMDLDQLCQIYEWHSTFCKFLKTTLMSYSSVLNF